jgi:hypothetical protein
MVPWPVAVFPVTSELPVAVADFPRGPVTVPWLVAVFPSTARFPVTVAEPFPAGPVRVSFTLPSTGFLPAMAF